MAQIENVNCNDIFGFAPPGKRGRKREYANDVARVVAHRARNNTKSLNVQISADLFAQLDKFLQFKDETKSHCVECALKQFLRSR
jgi:hypothetical protein